MTNEIKDQEYNAKTEACNRIDYARGGTLFLFWGPPILLYVVGSFLYGSGLTTLIISSLLLITSTGWLGIMCLFNAMRCGRIHCAIMGTLFPLLSLAGILGLAQIIPFDWGYYGAFFWGILIASFLTECLWRPYIRPS